MEPAASHLNDLLAGPDEAGTSLEGMNEQEVVKDVYKRQLIPKRLKSWWEEDQQAPQ